MKNIYVNKITHKDGNKLGKRKQNLMIFQVLGKLADNRKNRRIKWKKFIWL